MPLQPLLDDFVRARSHAYAWPLRVQTEPPCVSMRAGANNPANRIAGTAY
jgi:hypothetical protein